MLNKKIYIGVIIAIIAAAAALELWMGRLWFCKCGIVSLWSGDIWSNQNSQQLFDPYSFTHILHGIFIYFVVWQIFGKRLTVVQRLVIAVGLEAGWEIFENTSFTINNYRENTISRDYYGDSILNSVGDILAMILGFFLSWKFPTKLVIIAAIVVDLVLLFLIKDSLALNIIMLIHPFESIKSWQLR